MNWEASIFHQVFTMVAVNLVEIGPLWKGCLSLDWFLQFFKFYSLHPTRWELETHSWQCIDKQT